MLIRNSPTISPPVKRKVFLKSFTHSSLDRGWCAASQPANDPCVFRSSRIFRAFVMAASTFSRFADNARLTQQPLAVSGAVSRYQLGVEAAVCPPERLPFLENGEPGEPGLIDLEYEPLEQRSVVLQWETILSLMIGPMPLVSRRDVAVRGHR